MTVINAHTEHPDECLKFLNRINTDPEIRNLLNYGIENIHDTLDEKNQVHKISDSYRGSPYTQGKRFILNTIAGEPEDKWEIYQAFNEDCIPSSLPGFSPQTDPLEDKITVITKICDKYYAPITTGTVDYQVYLPLFQEELKAAGIEAVIVETQKQADEFIAKKSY